MAKNPQISGKMMIKVLRKVGFNVISQKGSHIKMRRLKPARKTIIVPNHKILRSGTLNNIIKHAEITYDDLKKLLK